MSYDDRYDECLRDIVSKVKTLAIPEFIEIMSDKHLISWATILNDMLIPGIECVASDKLFDKE